jgi:uncharacterized protein (TIGR02266 family)
MKVKEGKQILLTGDYKFSDVKMINLLVAGGHQIKLANNKNELIEELENVPANTDLLILDLQSPLIDSFSILEWIKGNDRVGKPPVLTVTSLDDVSKILEKTRRLKAAGLITKEITPEHFIYRVNRILYGDRNTSTVSSRVPTDIPVTFSSTRGTFEGSILNVSETGAYIHSVEDFQPDESIDLEFSLPGKDNTIELAGKIMWVNSLEEKESLFNGMGVNFTKMTSEDKLLLASFVEDELLRNQG